jgi:DNA polymerase-3 subunit beta
MKLKALREPFLQHLQFVAAVCPTRSPRPVLQDVLIKCEKGAIEMLATDGEVSVRSRLKGEDIEGEGSIALPAVTLLSAVRSMESDDLTIEPKGSLHELKSGKAVFKLNGDDPEMFPSIPTVDASSNVSVQIGAFVDLCNRTMFAAAKEMGRYAFNGVLMEIESEEIALVATDGRRLALARLATATGLTGRESRIVPLKGLAQIIRAVGDDEEATLNIGLLENQVGFGLPNTDVVVQLLEGDFPDFRAVLPKDKDVPKEVEMSTAELASAIRRAAVTAGDGARSVELTFGKGALNVSSRQEGVGEARSEMEIDYDGEEVGIRFNPEFLGDYLRTLAEPSVRFRFKDRASAGYFSSKSESVYVVMPITS